jgi:hypothetical protein
MLAALLLLGVAFTGSRTAYLNLLLLILAAHIFRSRGIRSSFSWAVTGLGVYFVLCVVLLPWLYSAWGIKIDADALHQRSVIYDARLQIWSLALQASMQRIWFGFGWGQIPEANFLVAEHAVDGLGMFNTSHNLFIDFILWSGYPIGLMLTVLVLWWYFSRIRNISTWEQAHYLLFVLMLGVHAMLELPLQYAYFLLPFGMIAGSLNAREMRPVAARIYDVSLARISILLGAAILYVTVVDYLKIETSNYGLRFEANRIATSIPNTPPEVRVLDQFNYFFVLARNHPSAGINQEEINRMRDSVNTVPSAQTMFNLAANLALNGESAESQHWLITLCKTMVDVNCREARLKWEHDAYPARTGVLWPLPESASTE